MSYRSSTRPGLSPAVVAASFAALAVLASVVPGASAVAPIPEGCVGPDRHVQGLGVACPTADGLFQFHLEDGTRLTTHGPDPVPTAATHGNGPLTGVKPRNASCVTRTDSQYHVQMVYAVPSNRPDRYADRIPYLRSMAEHMNGKLFNDGKEFDRPMTYRMACSGGKVSIMRVQLDIPIEDSNFINALLALRRAGLTNSFAKYWAFIDGHAPGLPGGTASFISDDRLAADNASNFGPGYAVFYDLSEDFTTLAMMHEGGHLFGSVQNSAPNTSGAAHCIEGGDIMCYNDGGPRASLYPSKDSCSSLHYDCGHNDYFNPKPGSNNYLATHWNTGSPLNRFFAGCLYKIGRLGPGAGGVDIDGSVGDTVEDWSNLHTKTFKIKSGCRGRDFALSGAYSIRPRQTDQAWSRILPLGPEAAGVGSVDAIFNRRVAAPNFDVCFLKDGTVKKCFTSDDEEVGRVPLNANKARITLHTGAPDSIYVFSII